MLRAPYHIYFCKERARILKYLLKDTLRFRISLYDCFFSIKNFCIIFNFHNQIWPNFCYLAYMKYLSLSFSPFHWGNNNKNFIWISNALQPKNTLIIKFNTIFCWNKLKGALSKWRFKMANFFKLLGLSKIL